MHYYFENSNQPSFPLLKEEDNFVKMPKTNSSLNQEQPTPLRRSTRLQHPKNPQEPEDLKNPNPKLTTFRGSWSRQYYKNRQESEDPQTPNLKPRSYRIRLSPIFNCVTPSSDRLLSSTPNSVPKKTKNDCTEKDSEKSDKSNDGSIICAKLSTGSWKSSTLRRSSRLSYRKNTNKQIEKRADVFLDLGNADLAVDSSEQFVGKTGGRLKSSSVGSEVVFADGGEKKARAMDKRTNAIGVSKKRKRGGEDDGLGQKWTKEQEMALQRAYFAAKPTPHFWKKVAKLVPGKSAQDCFDKVQSDLVTPPQTRRSRSRAIRTNSSTKGDFSLSASKLLEPREPKTKRSRSNKQKSHLAQKTVRHLLQKHYDVDKDNEVDLFSVLEPTMNSSTQAIFSTPEHVPEKVSFFQKLSERSSSGHKKSLSRFGASRIELVSPPVLKEVKNKALHERYIDQLHCREAKRKMASVRAAKLVAKNEDRKEGHAEKLDVLKAAKNALVSDAREVINQFQHLQANAMTKSFDFDDDDGIDMEDDDAEEGEDGS